MARGAAATGALAALLLSVLHGACATTPSRTPGPPTATPPPEPPPLAAPSPEVPAVDPNVRVMHGRAETLSAVAYSADQGALLRITGTTIAPRSPAPGQELTLTATIVALAPDDGLRVTVRETWAVRYAGVPLSSLPPRDLVLPQGTSQIQRTIGLPGDAAEGEYTAELVIHPISPSELAQLKAAAPFTVMAAARPGEPTTEPAGGTPPLEPRIVRIGAGFVDVRTGPGRTFRARARIPRDAPVQILEEREAGRERWYRVRLITGEEGWIPALAVAPARR